MIRLTDKQLIEAIHIFTNYTPERISYMGLPTISPYWHLNTPVAYRINYDGELILITNRHEEIVFSKEVAERLEK